MGRAQPETVWSPVEIRLHARNLHVDPYSETTVHARFKHEDGCTLTTFGCWDGDHDWLVRFSPPVAGEWSWETWSEPADRGLTTSGRFEAGRSMQDNRLLRHGFLRVADSARHLEHDDGEPFFWLADTVWAAGAKATPTEWNEYVRYRAEQGFSVVQFNTLPQQDASKPQNRLPFGASWDFDSIDPRYFQKLDVLFATAHEHGLVPAPVALWFNYVPDSHPDFDGVQRRPMTPADAKKFGQYLVARYGAYAPIWLFGEIDYTEPAKTVYDCVIDAIKAADDRSLLAAHLRGGWLTPDDVTEWADLYLYQTGHVTTSSNDAVRASEKHRALDQRRPVINGEPPYENHRYFDGDTRASRKEVRQAAWVSILSGANAGITYGAHGLWMWHRSGEFFTTDEAHMPFPWQEAIQFEGANDYALLSEILTRYAFETLEPRQDLLHEPAPLTRAAVIPEDEILLVYTPTRSSLSLDTQVNKSCDAKWIDPSTGRTLSARVSTGNVVKVETAPWQGDGLFIAPLPRR